MAQKQPNPPPTGQRPPPSPIPPKRKCLATQFSDSMVCPCGLGWDMNDPHPPACIPQVMFEVKVWDSISCETSEYTIGIETCNVPDNYQQKQARRIFGLKVHEAVSEISNEDFLNWVVLGEDEVIAGFHLITLANKDRSAYSTYTLREIK